LLAFEGSCRGQLTAGPGKTADMVQLLVPGAHGAKTMTAFFGGVGALVIANVDGLLLCWYFIIVSVATEAD